MVMKRVSMIVSCAGALILAGCAGEERTVTRTRTTQAEAPKPAGPQYLDAAHAPKGAGWIALITADLSGWRPRNTDRPSLWKVADGVMINAVGPGQHGVDIVTERKFNDFELYYEYRVPKGSNSGMYLRGRYEIQIVDDFGQAPGNGSNGSIYSVAAPAQNVSRPAGEWQSAYVKLTGKRATVVLNGVKIIDSVELPHATGGALDDKVDEPGPIMIQGDHGAVEVRNLMLRPIGG